MRLVIIGGGLRSDNAAVYRKMIEMAGGAETARIGIFSLASRGLKSSRRVKADFERHGLAGERVYLLEPHDLKRIRVCTGFFFVGGDQLRITEALLGTEGLQAIREVHARGGLVAGSSAGAAAQSERMLWAEEGVLPMDALRDGVRVSPGLGFFRGGIIDQHFNTYDGRHARLAWALLDEGERFGFGIDENTAMVVRGDVMEVLGTGGVTILDAAEASSAADGGIDHFVLHYLADGDRFHLTTHAFTLNPQKALIPRREEYRRGNRPITDLTQTNAFTRALTLDLVDNTAEQQTGLMLGTDERGYQFTFSKTARTEGYYGNVCGVDSYAALHVRMDIAPLSWKFMVY